MDTNARGMAAAILTGFRMMVTATQQNTVDTSPEIVMKEWETYFAALADKTR